jgi:hypothetical protein
MDVAKELAAGHRRVLRSIDRNVLLAEARIEGMEPYAYALKVDRERKAAADAAIRTGAEQFGANIRALADAWQAFAEGVARGFNGGLPSQQYPGTINPQQVPRRNT